MVVESVGDIIQWDQSILGKMAFLDHTMSVTQVRIQANAVSLVRCAI